MSSKITLRLAVLALGATFAFAPALAQYGPPQSPGIGPGLAVLLTLAAAHSRMQGS